MSRFRAVVPLAELPPGAARAVEVSGLKIALFNVRGEIFAVENRCPHHGVPLDDGVVRGNIVLCSMHGAEFDLRTGKHLSLPATCDIASYVVRVNDQMIEVAVPDEADSSTS